MHHAKPPFLAFQLIDSKKNKKLSNGAAKKVSNYTAFPLHIIHNLRRQGSFIRQTHLGGEGGVGHPSGRGPRCSLFHHAVHLFEGEAFGFRDQKVRVDEGDAAKAAPDEEDLGA